MNWKSLVAASCVVGCGLAVPAAWGQAVPAASKPAAPAVQPAPAAPEMSETDKMVQDIKHPVEWFTWGADLRIREEYIRDSRGLENGIDDNINMFRFRPRIWAGLGPFFGDESLGIPNGLSFFARFTDETRIFAARPTTGPFASSSSNPRTFDEIVPDNLYVEWKRIGSMPLSLKVGRQDLVYGRGWLILDGTPLDGSRTIYSDAIKATIHFDQVKTDLDLFGADNKARETRLGALSFENPQKVATYMSDYDTHLLGAYLKSMYFAPMEVNAYYIYKDDDLASDHFFGGKEPNGRIVHTIGGLVQGTACTNWDYYLESAYQWGNEGAITGISEENPRQSWGLNSDLGYTFVGCPVKPRVHGSYEYLSGDDPGTSHWEGWDPIMSRWPQWSELYIYRWQFEGNGDSGTGPVGSWTNVQRFTVGASAQPIARMTASLDYSFLLANEHSYTKTVPGTVKYGGGDTRGHLFVGKLLYDFNKYVSGHLWAEYFMPSSFYDSSRDNSVFLRWEVTFKF